MVNRKEPEPQFIISAPGGGGGGGGGVWGSWGGGVGGRAV